MHKSKLQELCRQRRWALAMYSSIKDGPDHCACFRSSVHVAGRCFDAPVACSSLKEARNEAAKVACVRPLICADPYPGKSMSSGLTMTEEACKRPLGLEPIPTSKLQQNLEGEHALVPASRIIICETCDGGCNDPRSRQLRPNLPARNWARRLQDMARSVKQEISLRIPNQYPHHPSNRLPAAVDLIIQQIPHSTSSCLTEGKAGENLSYYLLCNRVEGLLKLFEHHTPGWLHADAHRP